MPKIDFIEEERAALADLAREYVRAQRYPLAPADGADQSGIGEAGGLTTKYLRRPGSGGLERLSAEALTGR